MFRALNTELDDLRNKVELEKEKLINLYNDTLLNGKYEEFLECGLIYKENESILQEGKSNILYNFVKNRPLPIVEDKLIKFKICENKQAFYMYIRKVLNMKDFIKTRNLLNKAKNMGWYDYEYMNLNTKLNNEYYYN
ncbi:hypothetical protein A0H76_978 [Hepatospora eriocheir]|uniref:Uncharacterized protein n=1 Tax=Hepatospora eriocheir TaxID=1081669 RepID=A0A1X0QHW9_9MICR|nr:hypothetical protein A0H76_978 [Hepatospora eriocheir]